MTWDHLHEEDVLFEFNGNDPDELTVGRFYRGEVDGFAEFGVFVNIGSNVTGLLHRSKLDRRLESLTWDEGDEVIVQVADIRENGDVDLDWSIRQSADEFRGAGADGSNASDPEPTPETEDPPTASTSEPQAPTPSQESEGTEAALSRVPIEALADKESDRVRVDAQISEIRQTNGPTIFTLEDGTGSVEAAAFESAGVRAYPDIDEDDVVRVVGVVESHRGTVQLEVESVEELEAETAASITDAIKSAAAERAAPDSTELLTSDPQLDAIDDAFGTTATRLRRAVYEDTPIVLRHPASVDGVISAAAIEHALHAAHEAADLDSDIDRQVDRRPMDEPWYDLGDAMYDHGAGGEEQTPLVVVVNAGTTEADRSALSFHALYDTEVMVIDCRDTPTDDAQDNRALIGPESRSCTTVAASLAGMIADSVRSTVAPLPAISYRGDPPVSYADLAAEHGVDSKTARERYEAIALVAYYQRYDDKRELVADLLFEPDAAALAAHISAQYRERIQTAVETAQANCDRISMVGTTIASLDATEHSHRYDFPPRDVLASELLDSDGDDNGTDVVLVFDTDACYVATEESIDLDALADDVAAHLPDAAVDATRDRLTFLAGRRSDVTSTLLDRLPDHLT